MQVSIAALLSSPVRRMPEMHRVVYKNYLRGLVRRFPYAVFYEHAESRVTVYGIWHISRDPAKWRQRLLWAGFDPPACVSNLSMWI